MFPEARRYKSRPNLHGPYFWIKYLERVSRFVPNFFQKVWKNSAIAEVGLVDFDFHLSLAWDYSVKIHHGSNAHIIWLDFIQGIIFLLPILIISITCSP